jgi:cytochrome c-type biogenesis protein CcmH
MLVVFLLLFPLCARADAAQDEARAQRLFTEVRCVACQSQDIGDSEAKIAGDMRQKIRREIAAGWTDAQIRQNLVRTYGDYVLFRPRLSKGNAVLWGLPFLLVLLGGGVLYWLGKRSSQTRDYALSRDEEEKLREIMKPKD